MTTSAELDLFHMRRALELAEQGRGRVEPNPLVGCVIARGAEMIAEGFHRQYGGPHAEIDALRLAGARAAGTTLYVTLEPCCHWGKTPPCSQAVIAAGVARVVAAMSDPFPRVAGGGLAELKAAGIETAVGVLEEAARSLNAPYLMRLAHGRPWVIAKWAMSLDGKLATHARSSRWISSEASRATVHALRGRVDAILVGRGTVVADDPLLTARPPGARIPLRIVLDRQATLPSDRRLFRTLDEAPVLVAAGPTAAARDVDRLRALGCEVWQSSTAARGEQLGELLLELGRREMTNLLVEGGAELFGTLLDGGWIDEVHAFVAPCLVGGAAAVTPIGGRGVEQISDALRLKNVLLHESGGDLYLQGRVDRDVAAGAGG